MPQPAKLVVRIFKYATTCRIVVLALMVPLRVTAATVTTETDLVLADAQASYNPILNTILPKTVGFLPY